jgi:ubiquitin carboxyl-terminal hydrolase 25/28
MSTAAIIEAYKQQISEDASWMAPRYLTCLKQIAILRGGTDRDTIEKVVQAAYAEGKYADEDVAYAYSFFGFNNAFDSSITDEEVLERFYNSLNSSKDETQARQELWRIGDSRDSMRLKAAADDCMLFQSASSCYFHKTHFDHRCFKR